MNNFFFFFFINSRLEIQGTFPYLKDQPVTNTLKTCDNTLIDISKRYLTKVADFATVAYMSDSHSQDQMNYIPATKKLKLIGTGLMRQQRNFDYSRAYEQHIHTVMSILDILKIGEVNLAMDINVKWVEIISLYFFWSLINTGMLFKNKFQTPDKVFLIS